VNFLVKILGGGHVPEVFSGLQKYPAHELVLARSIVSFTMSFVIIKRNKIPFFGVNKKWLLIRALSGIIALTIFFYTIHFLPLAIASTIQYLAPIFTVLLAMHILKEHVKFFQWIFIGLAFVGVGLIAFSKFTQNTSGQEISILWLSLGIVSAAFSGMAYTAIIKLRETDKPITIVMYFPMVAIPIMIIMCLFQFTIPSGIEWFYLLTIGVFTQFAQILMTKALHLGSASTITPFQYLGAVYAFLIGYFVFDEQFSLIVEIGILLIFSGILANAFIRRT
jgi:drug/metabolite transporter (DMT)-like permease